MDILSLSGDCNCESVHSIVLKGTELNRKMTLYIIKSFMTLDLQPLLGT